MFKKIVFILSVLFVLSTQVVFAQAEIGPGMDYLEVTRKEEYLSDENNEIFVDLKQSSNGYIEIKYTGEILDEKNTPNPTILIELYKKDSPKTQYTYTISEDHVFIPFVLAYGSGDYHLEIWRGRNGNYNLILEDTFFADISNEFEPFLHSNIFVNYENAPEISQIANSLKKECVSVTECVNRIYEFCSYTLKYDFDKFSTEMNYYNPNLSEIYSQKKGTCFDYASLMAGMLRSINIPTKMEFGFVNGNYHAWVNVYLNDLGVWKKYDPTYHSNLSDEILQNYMNNPNNYRAIYIH